MKDAIIKSYEENKNYAVRWVNTAIKDAGTWIDKGECFRSLCNAYRYAGKAEQCAQILAHDYGMKSYILEIYNFVFETLGSARESIIQASIK